MTLKPRHSDKWRQNWIPGTLILDAGYTTTPTPPDRASNTQQFHRKCLESHKQCWYWRHWNWWAIVPLLMKEISQAQFLNSIFLKILNWRWRTPEKFSHLCPQEDRYKRCSLKHFCDGNNMHVHHKRMDKHIAYDAILCGSENEFIM